MLQLYQTKSDLDTYKNESIETNARLKTTCEEKSALGDKLQQVEMQLATALEKNKIYQNEACDVTHI